MSAAVCAANDSLRVVEVMATCALSAGVSTMVCLMLWPHVRRGGKR